METAGSDTNGITHASTNAYNDASENLRNDGITHASLFSGVGGFDLAALWLGWKNIFACEIDPLCRLVLQKNFGQQHIIYEDIKKTDFTGWRGCIRVLSGGFPCQPFSLAGKRLGSADDRHLWPEMLRAIHEIQPEYILGENVLGILNWSRGLVFEQVCIDLENAGYEIIPFVLPACGIDAPHERNRVWLVAHSAKGLFDSSIISNKITIQELEDRWSSDEDNPPIGGKWLEYNTDRRTLRDDDGFSEGLHRIAQIGNAVVPGLVFQIFSVIDQMIHATPI